MITRSIREMQPFIMQFAELIQIESQDCQVRYNKNLEILEILINGQWIASVDAISTGDNDTRVSEKSEEKMIEKHII